MNKFKKWQTEKGNFEKIKNSMVTKILTLVVIFSSNSPKKQSKRIIEAEPTKWLQSKDPWKSDEFDILIKDSVWNIEKWALNKHKK